MNKNLCTNIIVYFYPSERVIKSTVSFDFLTLISFGRLVAAKVSKKILKFPHLTSHMNLISLFNLEEKTADKKNQVSKKNRDAHVEYKIDLNESVCFIKSNQWLVFTGLPNR